MEKESIGNKDYSDIGPPTLPERHFPCVWLGQTDQGNKCFSGKLLSILLQLTSGYVIVATEAKFLSKAHWRKVWSHWTLSIDVQSKVRGFRSSQLQRNNTFYGLLRDVVQSRASFSKDFSKMSLVLSISSTKQWICTKKDCPEKLAVKDQRWIWIQ